MIKVFTFLAVIFSLTGRAPEDPGVWGWIRTTGDWGVAENWSTGVEPVSTNIVKIHNGGIAQITQSGEKAKYLYVSTSVGNGAVDMSGGSLSVAGSLYIGQGGGAGTFDLSGGSVYMTSFGAIGYSGVGTLTQTGGDFKGYEYGTAISRYGGSDGSVYAIFGGLFSTTTFGVGQGASGTFRVVGDDATIEIRTAFTQYEHGTLEFIINADGISEIQLINSAAATLGGTLTVSDSGAVAGTYPLITAEGGISGAFDTVNLPPGWSWGITGNSLWVTVPQIAFDAVPFDYIYPELDVPEMDPLSNLEVSLAKDEYEPLTFALRSSVDLPEITATINLPTLGNTSLPADAVELRVVKVWEQSVPLHWAVGETPETKRVPELLLTDDVTDPAESWTDNMYNAPAFPTHLYTQLLADETKQFWVTVRVETNTPSGTYEGSIQLLSEGRPFLTLPLEVTVLPYTLPPPEKIYSIYFRPHVEPFNEDDPRSMSEERYLNELRSLKEHGFNSLSFHEIKMGNISNAYQRITSVGFPGPIVLLMENKLTDTELKEYADMVIADGRQPWVYAIDEVSSTNQIGLHTNLVQRIHAAGAKAMTALRSDMCDHLDDIEPLDWANVSQAYIPITHPVRDYSGQAELMADGHPYEHELVTYYWQCYMEDPCNNRRQAGFYLWRSGIGGIKPYDTSSYWAMHPYHEDVIDFYPSGRYKPFATYYPAQGKPVPTLDYEALREGADDVRYLRMVESLLSTASAPDQEEAETALKTILDPFYWIHRESDARDLRVSPSAGHFAWARASLIEVIAFLRGDTSSLNLPTLEPTPFRWNRMEVVGIEQAEDTFVREGTPDTNNEGKGYFSFGVYGEGNRYRAFIRYDLSEVPSNRTITSATLSVCAYGFGSPETMTGVDISAYRVLQEWNPAECTWNNRSAGTPWNSPGASGAGVDIGSSPEDTGAITNRFEWCSLDVTATVLQQLAQPESNHGFMLRFENEDWTQTTNTIHLASMEAHESNMRWWPKLVIKFEE